MVAESRERESWAEVVEVAGLSSVSSICSKLCALSSWWQNQGAACWSVLPGPTLEI